jgi:adenylate cyclase
MVAARIDRLPEREKQVLQAAAVIGREFSAPVLEAVAEIPGGDLAESLRVLTAAEFLYEQSLYPVAEYAFKHPLTQEVAYGSQLGERRAQVHASVARAIERLDADKLDERSALLAHHWEQAGKALEAARWHARAAQWVGASDPIEMLRHCGRVRSLLDEVPESSEIRALGVTACLGVLMGGWRMGMPEAEVEAVFRQGREFASRGGDLRAEAWLVAMYGAARGVAGEAVDHNVAQALEAASLAERSGDPGVILAVAFQVVYAHYCAGRLDDAWRSACRALESPPADPRLGSDLTGFCPCAMLEFVRGMIALHMGSLDVARRAYEQAAVTARRLGDLETLGFARGDSAALAVFTGETEGCLEHCREGFEIAERMGSGYSRVVATSQLGIAHLAREDWAKATEFFSRCLDLARRHRTSLENEAMYLSNLAMAQLGLGETDAALEAADQAIALAQTRGTPVYEINAQLARARVLRQTEGSGAASEIDAALARAHALIEQTSARAYEPSVHEERAMLWTLLGDAPAAQRELREAHRLYTEMGATGHAERLARELGL